MTRQTVSVIFSFRNEEDNLPELIRRLQAMSAGQALAFEFIFVNDVSDDRSIDILRSARAADERVKILTMARRSGPSECVLAGMAASAGDAVVYMDSDLQDPPELIPELIARWQDGAEIVHTRRAARLGEDPVRMWLTRRAYEVINWTSRGQMPIESGDFKLLTRRAVTHLLSLKEHDPYIRGLAVWMGFRQDFVSYERQPRLKGVSKFSGIHRNAVKTMVAGVTSFSFLPIYLVVWAGIAGMVLATLLALVAVITALAGGPAATPSWLALALFLWGSLMAAVGTLGLYVARIYKDVRARPRWIVGEAEGLPIVSDSSGFRQ